MPKTDHRIHLTPTKVAGLKLAKAGQRYQVMDAVVPGFGVRVSDKSKTFILRAYFLGGASAARRAIAEVGAISLAEARERARCWRDLIARGIDPADQERREREAAIIRHRTTFAAVVDDFIRDKLPTERRGRETERYFHRDLLPAWGELPITEITDLQIVGLIKQKARKRKGVAMTKGSGGPAVAIALLMLTKRLFQWAVDQRVYGLTISPAAGLKAKRLLGDTLRPRWRTLSDDELLALWRAAARTPYPAGPAIRLLLLTGLRSSEVVDAAWDEFNFREGIWIIPPGRMKSWLAHAVPLVPDILAVVESLPRFNGGKFLFSTTGGKSPFWLNAKVKDRLDRKMLRSLRAMARARGDDPRSIELPHFVIHDIRRSVRSRLSRLRIAEEVREAVLAHVRPGIARVYDHHDYFTEKTEALTLWHTQLKAIVAPPVGNIIPLHATA